MAAVARVEAIQERAREMEQRQMSVSVIQAANRICCRHVIDAEGHCPPADIFIVLPQDAMGEAVLEDIKADMSGSMSERGILRSIARR